DRAVVLHARVRCRRGRREQGGLVRARAFELDVVLGDVDVLVIGAGPDLDLVARLGGVDRGLDGLTRVHRVGGPVGPSRRARADDGGGDPAGQHRGIAWCTYR